MFRGAMTLMDQRPWGLLDADAKRTRALRVAGELFARDGIDVAMPVLAEAIGVGVGSIYRLFGGKEDIVAALVAQRVERVTARFEAALERADPWAALCGVTFGVVDDALADRLTQEAWAVSSEHPAVIAVRPRAAAGLDALVERARAAGALRPDAGPGDLRLVFRVVQEVEDLSRGGARRLAELALRGMSADGTTA